MRKFIIYFVLTIIVNAGVFSNENINVSDEIKTAKNSISGGFNVYYTPFYSSFYDLSEFSMPGLSIEYERMLGNKFSVNAEISGNLEKLRYLEIQGRFYPWSKMFYTGVGLGVNLLGGYQWFSIFNSDGTMENIRVWDPEIFPSLSVEFGWKIGIGKMKRWFFRPSVTGIFVYDHYPPYSYLEFLTRLSIKTGYSF